MNRLEIGLASCSLLAGIPLPAIQQHCPSAQLIHCAHNSVIYAQGQRIAEVFCILEGQVKLSRLSDEGGEFTTGLLSNAELFGAALNEAPFVLAPESASMKGEGYLLRMRVSEFRQLLLVYPPLGLRVVELLDRRRQQMERRLECFAFKRTESRLVETLRELSGSFETRCEHGFGQHIRLSQQELADLIGATRPVVSTILNRLRKDGVLGYSREYVCIREIDLIAKTLALSSRPTVI